MIRCAVKETLYNSDGTIAYEGLWEKRKLLKINLKTSASNDNENHF